MSSEISKPKLEGPHWVTACVFHVSNTCTRMSRSTIFWWASCAKESQCTPQEQRQPRSRSPHVWKPTRPWPPLDSLIHSRKFCPVTPPTTQSLIVHTSQSSSCPSSCVERWQGSVTHASSAEWWPADIVMLKWTSSTQSFKSAFIRITLCSIPEHFSHRSLRSSCHCSATALRSSSALYRYGGQHDIAKINESRAKISVPRWMPTTRGCGGGLCRRQVLP